MDIYIYKAKKSNAETVAGKIKAHSKEEAIELINQLGLIPVSLMLKTESLIKKDRREGKVKSKEVFIFSRQLSNLLKSGTSLLRSLHIIEDQTVNSYFKKAISLISLDVKNGKTFSDSIAAYPKIFSPLYITMIRAGEESGNLQETLISISAYQKKQEEVLSKVRSSLSYPLFMALMGFCTVYFILTFVAPKMAGLFSSLSALPLPTIILLKMSDFISHNWFFFVVVFLLSIISVRVLKDHKRFKAQISGMILHMPLLGEIILKAELGRFCRSIVLLLKSGVSIIKALQISIPILSNERIKQHLNLCLEDLISGGSLGESIKKSKDIPLMMGHLIAVGEESGNLNEALNEIADSYELEVDEKIKTFTNLLEPMMILTVGLLVGFIVFAMLLPIFQIDAFMK